MDVKEDMISTHELNEAFCDSWVLAGKPDDVWQWYARCSQGARTEPLELFRQAFSSGETEASQTAATHHQAGYDLGHDDGTQRGWREGVIAVAAALLEDKDPATEFPELWREAVCQRMTRDGDGS